MYRSTTNKRPFWFVLGVLFSLVITNTIAFSPFRPQTVLARIQGSITKTNGKIVFISNRNGFLDVYVMNADGSNQRQLTFGSINPANGFTRTRALSPVWSPDGSQIAFSGSMDYGRFNLNVINADGTRIRKLTTDMDIGNPTWSPNGQQIAFSDSCVAFDGGTCETDIYVVNVDGTNLKKLTAPNGGPDVQPSWSPDGTKIAFTRDSAGMNIFVVNADGTGEMQLTKDTSPDWSDTPAWSPDGTKIAFRRSDDLYVMNADGSNPVRLTTGRHADEYGVAWSPDGMQILFTDGRAKSNRDVFVINADGTNRRNLSNNAANDYVGDWQPRFLSDTNPVDETHFFVSQHYLDFLSREPDPAGLSFWTSNIASCGGEVGCLETHRRDVSAAYFLSIEFQESGYFVYRFYNTALNRANGLPRFHEFMRDTQSIGDDVIVNSAGWEQRLEQHKQTFAQDFVTRPEFATLYPETLTPAQYVDALYQHAGITPSSTERQAALDEFNNPTGARARVMRRVAENQTLFTREFNRAFVVMQYFGYLRRNPDDPPDGNLNGYNSWLGKLNDFHGNYIDAEMVKAFLLSTEYRSRFGLP